VDSRLDALIHKTRIAIQIQPSRLQSAWFGRVFNRYGNYVFNFNHPDACLSWSGHALNRYGNCVLKINRPNCHPPWSERAKPYMEITYSGRATIRTAIPLGPDMRSLIWKLLAADVRPSGRQCLTVRTRLSNRKDFQ
jgi:hypothetical protein